MEQSTRGYAPIDAENGKLWTDACKGETQHRIRIYDNAEAAEKNKVNDTDIVKEVKITWEDGR